MTVLVIYCSDFVVISLLMSAVSLLVYTRDEQKLSLKKKRTVFSNDSSNSGIFSIAAQKISNVVITFNDFTPMMIVKINAASKPDLLNFNITDTLECRAVIFLNKKKIYI